MKRLKRLDNEKEYIPLMQKILSQLDLYELDLLLSIIDDKDLNERFYRETSMRYGHLEQLGFTHEKPRKRKRQ
jgi:hypothetical protein